jgi:hypothetical protein
VSSPGRAVAGRELLGRAVWIREVAEGRDRARLRIQESGSLLVALGVAAGDITGGQQDRIVDRRRLEGREAEGGSSDERYEYCSRERGELPDWSTPGQSPPFCRPLRMQL